MALNGTVLAFTGSVAAAATTDIQPGASEEWLITSVGGGATATGIAQTGHIYLYDNTVPATILLRHGDTASSANDMIQWTKPMRFGLTNTRMLRIKNITAGSLKYTYSGRITGVGTAGIGDIKSGITASVAAGSYITVQPPAGQSWVLLEAGIEEGGWVDGGGTRRYYPDIEVMMYNGTDEASMQRGSDWTIFRPLRIAFDNTTYLRIYNRRASAYNVGYIAQRIY